MKKYLILPVLVIILTMHSSYASPVVGEVAPNFKAMDTNANAFELSAQKGKIVVLEWTNHQCPFVRKHYESKNMQSLQKKYIEQEVVWVSIISSSPGKQGYLESGSEANRIFKERDSAPSHIIRDENGKIGKLYNAATTPHMFVVNKDGKLVYQGAIDSISSADKDDIVKAENFVANALDAIMQSKEVVDPVTTPYGCSVKY